MKSYTQFGLISIFMTFAVVGNYTPVIGLNALRGFGLFFLVVSVTLFSQRKIYINLPLKVTSALFFTWVGWGAVYMAITGETDQSWKELLDVMLGFTLLSSIALFATSGAERIKVLLFGWIGAFVLTSAFSLRELVTGDKLQSTFEGFSQDYYVGQFYLVSTFDNPNNLAAFLVLLFPFLLASLAIAHSNVKKIILTAFIFGLLYQLTLSGSRGGVIAAGMVLGTWILIRNGPAKFIAFVVVSLSLAVALSNSDEILDYFFGDTALGSKLNLYSADLEYGSSRERFYLLVNGLYLLVSTYGVGVGPGMFAYAMLGDHLPYGVQVFSPHNFFIEIGSQYGIVTLTLFASLLVLLLLRFIRYCKVFRDDPFFQAIACACASGLVGYPVAATLNSSFITSQFNWIFLGTVIGCACVLEGFDVGITRRRLDTG